MIEMTELDSGTGIYILEVDPAMGSEVLPPSQQPSVATWRTASTQPPRLLQPRLAGGWQGAGSQALQAGLFRGVGWGRWGPAGGRRDRGGEWAGRGQRW